MLDLRQLYVTKAIFSININWLQSIIKSLVLPVKHFLDFVRPSSGGEQLREWAPTLLVGATDYRRSGSMHHPKCA